MQLGKYSLEKKLKEFERKQQVYSSSSDNQMAQVDKLGETAAHLSKQFSQLTEKQDRLAKNGKS